MTFRLEVDVTMATTVHKEKGAGVYFCILCRV